MPLNNSAADALADAFCAANGVTDAAAIGRWRSLAELIYSHLKTDIDIIIQAGSIVTTGSPTTQTGPAAPITIHPD